MDLLTIADAAAKIDVHERTLRGWIARGHLPAVRAGARLWLIRPADLATAAATVRPRGNPRIHELHVAARKKKPRKSPTKT